MTVIGLIVYSNLLVSQECTELTWRTGERLTPNDFCIKVANSNSPIFGQFNLSYQPPAFGLFSNNFNKKVTNILIRNASWIDTTYDEIDETIRYQQILFDMAEVYCRKFRQRMLEQKKKIALGIDFVENINSEIMKEFSVKRAAFELEYADGNDETVKLKWEEWIKVELDRLSKFDYDYTGKIKLKPGTN